jgi:hypothetical protein
VESNIRQRPVNLDRNWAPKKREHKTNSQEKEIIKDNAESASKIKLRSAQTGRQQSDGGSERPTTTCFFNGALRCNPKFVSSFNVWCRGQDAASEAHH